MIEINYRQKAETAAIKHLITKIYPTGVISVIADSYDFWTVISEVSTKLKQDILSRKPNAFGLCKTVFRPDSGDPADVICGINIMDHSKAETLEQAVEREVDAIENYVQSNTAHGECGEFDAKSIFKYQGKCYSLKVEFCWDRYDKQYYYLEGTYVVSGPTEVQLTPEQKGAVECLWDIFGGTLTSTGHKLLDEHVGTIYGDSITIQRADEICARLAAKGFASGNVVFGMGSYGYQVNSRDSFGFAMKATYAEVKGQGRAIFKQPRTDSGKNSAKGLLRVEEENGTFVLYQEQTKEQEKQGALKSVYRNGVFETITNLDEIRGRVDATL